MGKDSLEELAWVGGAYSKVAFGNHLVRIENEILQAKTNRKEFEPNL